MLELHSTPLSAFCLRSVQLTQEGKSVGYTTGALYVGNLCHAALLLLHCGGTLDACIESGIKAAESQARADNKPLSEAVIKNQSEHNDEARSLCAAYERRCMLPPGSTMIGCELPIRAKWVVDDEPFLFASHLDMLWRRPDGVLVVRDWKSGGDSPSPMYLSRQMQLAAYHWAVGTGEVLIDGSWIAFEEFPELEWVHLRNLTAYQKATTTKDDDGNLVKYAKGDEKPLRSALIPLAYTTAGRDAAWREIALRVRMMRAGYWPTNPSPDGCRFCSCKADCPGFDFPNTGGQP